ncbi:MAG: glycosyltransferase family 4 protein [Saprospiraceae bacterium]|nr:glycosyltransferase family 4 protein [Saprospiraceae bacterium]
MSEKIKVGYEAKRVFQNFTGLGNYSRTLLEILSEQQPDLELHTFAPKRIQNDRTAPFLQKPFFNHFAQSGSKSLWRSRGMVSDLIREDIQVFHGLSHEIPFGIEKTSVKSVVTIHDLIFRRIPSDFKAIDRWIYDIKFRSACRRSDIVVAISESTKKDIQYFYKIPAEKIQVIYQTIDPQFFRTPSEKVILEIRKKLKLPEDYFLYVGSVIPRKNLKLIVEAYGHLNDPGFPPLLIVGDGGDYKKEVEKEIRKLGLEAQVRFLKADFFDLPVLYKEALALCYPSKYEGFGLPLVESLASGSPVITFRGSSLPEAAGPGALYLENQDAEELASLLKTLAEDEGLRQKLSQAGALHIQKFEASEIARQWAELYQGLIV